MPKHSSRQTENGGKWRKVAKNPAKDLWLPKHSNRLDIASGTAPLSFPL
jgi:hypothetical protein